MAIETPTRRRLPNPGMGEQRPDDPKSTATRRGPGGAVPPPGGPAAPPAGPSWREFLALQASMLVAVALLFGLVAFAFIARAGGGGASAADQPAAANAPAAAPPAATAVPTVVPAADAPRLPLPQVAPPVGRRAATTVKVSLEAQETVALLDEGIAYTYWTYGGTVPGPMIRVRQGDTVEVTLRNPATNKVAHSIDLHAATGPGGGSEVTAVAPGGEKTFSFQALNPGVFVYRDATSPAAQQAANGMYGLIVVEPPQGLPVVDREFYVMQGEFYLTGERGDRGTRQFSNEKLLAENPEYVVFNGSVGALGGQNALRAKTGETIRIFFGVGGPNLTSSFHITGEIFDRVAVEGATLEDPTRWATNVQTTAVPVGGATIVDLKVDVPGRYPLIDHSLGREAKGATADLLVDGPENPTVFTPQH